MADIEKQRSDALTNRINAKYREVEGLARSAVEAGIELGGMLTEKKAELPHGQFGGWVREHFAGSERHAQRFMKLYRERDQLAAKTTSMSDLSLTEALNAISPPKEDDGRMSQEEFEELTKKIHEHIRWAEEEIGVL